MWLISISFIFILVVSTVRTVRSPLKYLRDEPTIRDLNFLVPAIDKHIIETAKNVSLDELFVHPPELPLLRVFVRRAKPPEGVDVKGDIILLPGTLQNSNMWAKDTKSSGQSTLALLAAAGFNAYSVDVPGVIGGRSVGILPPGVSPAQGMDLVITELGLHKPVLLSATGSGLLGIPYASEHHKKLSAFISAAACCAGIGQNWAGLMIPVLVIRGERDVMIPAPQFLAAPMHNIVIIPGAALNSWSAQPDQFHAALINFLAYVFENKVPEKDLLGDDLKRAKTGKSTKTKGGQSQPKENSVENPKVSNEVFEVEINSRLEQEINKRDPSDFQLNLLKTSLLSKGKFRLARQVEYIQKKRNSPFSPSSDRNVAGQLLHGASQPQKNESKNIASEEWKEDLDILDAVENIDPDSSQNDSQNKLEDQRFESTSDLIGLRDSKAGDGFFFDWKNEDFEAPRDEEHMPKKLKIDQVSVQHQTISLPDGSELFFRHANPLSGSSIAHQVLILHDRGLHSKLWELQNTLKILAAANFEAIAVDLPGYGRSEGECHPLTCLKNIMSVLDLHNPILVIPGWSGRFAMPYILSNSDQLTAVLALSPETADRYPKGEYEQINIPALAIHSDRNEKENVLTAPFNWMPNGQQLILREAVGRPYLLSVDRFHTVLLNFVQAVAQSTSPL